MVIDFRCITNYLLQDVERKIVVTYGHVVVSSFLVTCVFLYEDEEN